MTTPLVIRAALIWIAIALLAIGNGILRDKVLVFLLGRSVALPVSGFILAAIVFCVTYFSFGFFGEASELAYGLIGLQWVGMTLAFEFLFGHYVAGKSWKALLDVLNLAKGDLFLLVLIVSFLSPYLVAKLKGAA